MMVTRKFHVLKTQFETFAKGLLSKSLYGNMVGVVGSMWVLVCSYFFVVFGFVSRYMLRFQADNPRDQSQSSWISDISVFKEEEEEEEEEEDAFFDSSNSKIDEEHGEEETGALGFSETVSAASTDPYEFRYGKDVSCYMEEPTAMSFVVQELYADWSNSNINGNQEKTAAETEDVDDQEKTEEKTEDFDEDREKAQDLAESVCTEEHPFKSFSFMKFPVAEIAPSGTVKPPETASFGEHDSSDDVQSLVQNRAAVSDSKEESATSRGGGTDEVDSITYEFDVGRNVSERLEPQSLVIMKGDEQTVKMNTDDFQLHEFSIPNSKEVLFSDSENGSDDEYIEFSKPQVSDFKEEVGPQIAEQSAEEIGLQEANFGSDQDGEDEDDEPWEHDDLIEQLKNEIRNGGGGRLPTILEEETECTDTVDNLKLKPLVIEEKLEFKDRMAEIQKVYKSYAEKMKKLDILNNQTMHAIGFLQLKDQVRSMSIQKSSTFPLVKSLISQNLWRCKTQRHPTALAPMPKVVGDLHKDFELVYVGQVCLSWEILNWQHGKALELQQYDNQTSHHRYNLVATEFQLFQVLLQRFIEDDPFQGPRVQHYVRNRCVLCNLLQVPPIKDDKKHLTRGEEETIILSGMLVKIIEESMHIFWNFVRTDERNANLKGLQETQVDHKDLELLLDIRKDLQKKEKKLKEIHRSENCVVKKFQKHQERRLEHSLFIAQVELRLISRVLNLSKIKTEQLVWCHEKLENINFVHRKVHVEPSFLLFPC
ncbi:uncharacterized protein LOC125477831 isoform X1 [Pyrus x bretschneideri]|uniref:uncharacterized protein LOC125477831 isoform X1 n=1 Tax=Pyrus x bretschneideri TaxID=225117 RepID=UPI00202F10D6|nr:uncharacterized protein LOC125477831 isoform X1 [Pyrus x bretschneideri]